MIKLGVNIDHIATLRQVRKAVEPDPIHASVLAELGGADGITVHLREDRRHIQERDVRILHEIVKTKLNLEMALVDNILNIALDIKPQWVCFVPERRQELTTEGGLNVIMNKTKLRRAITALHEKGIKVTVFVDQDIDSIKLCKVVGVNGVEIHTGRYADADTSLKRSQELEKLRKTGDFAVRSGLIFNAGHGLTYQNIQPIAAIPGLNEVNIGHSIISRATLVGMERAVREMKELLSPE